VKTGTVILALAILLPLCLPPALPAPVGIPILVDLTHKQPSAGIEEMIKAVPEGKWYILVDSEDTWDALSPLVKTFATKIVGTFDSVNLEAPGITVIIVGQVQKPFTPSEITAIVNWFNKQPGRVFWIAADSDHPAQGGEASQKISNMVLEALGTNLRLDYTSVEDEVSNAGAGYRVLAVVNTSDVPVITYGCDRVLFHGPGPVAWVDDAGNWHKLTKTEKPANTSILATTTVNGMIVENSGETPAQVYKAGETGVFTLMAAQRISVGGGLGTIIVSGETPYGGYQPGVTWAYYGIPLNGLRFFRNVILWSTGYMGELREYEKLVTVTQNVQATLDQRISQLTSQVESTVDSLRRDVNTSIAAVQSSISTAMALGAVALILSIVAIALALRKPKTG